MVLRLNCGSLKGFHPPQAGEITYQKQLQRRSNYLADEEQCRLQRAIVRLKSSLQTILIEKAGKLLSCWQGISGFLVNQKNAP
ncbi:MAG: hypothetical protein HC916_06930 [Coleofasciculaceae cyanobacterium SM2_1_6]|nr:hypothetical protein [Coleofasciculaceae cyanobacterium SM2_1_6]